MTLPPKNEVTVGNAVLGVPTAEGGSSVHFAGAMAPAGTPGTAFPTLIIERYVYMEGVLQHVATRPFCG